MKNYSIKFSLLMIIFFYSFNLEAKENSIYKMSGDSLYIKKSHFNKKENSFEFILFYKTKNDCFEVYKKKVVDYSIEFEYSFSYSDSIIEYSCFNVDDLTTGLKWSILYNKKEKLFYITDAYDFKALGDKAIRKSADFNKCTIKIESIDNEQTTYYYIKFKKIELTKSMRCKEDEHSQ